MSTIRARTPADPALARLLSRHPRVELSAEPVQTGALEFEQGGRLRRIHVGTTEAEVYGLVEVMDNNPLVCADEASVPTPAATLGLIALCPLIRSGLILEEPAVRFSFPAGDIEPELRCAGWHGGAVVDCDNEELGDVLAAVAHASIPTPSDPNEVESLFEEAYGKAFYVRSAAGKPWSTSEVLGAPWAAYALSLTSGEGTSLATVRVMADRDGKCGAAQLVHVMNVMAGFEECLGIDGHSSEAMTSTPGPATFS